MAEDKIESRRRGRPRSWGDTSGQNVVKSLDRAIDVLTRLARLGSATLTDLANDLGESPATVYRTLYTFQTRGIVDFEEAAQTWHIGAQAFHIGSHFLRRTSLVERARPVLRMLMRATEETANLAFARDGQVLFVSQVETHQSIRAFFPPGTLSPMHASGVGKALLAHLPEDDVTDIVGAHGLERFTRFTHTQEATLKAELSLIRSRGYAIDNEEKNLGMRCVAAPIFDMYGEAVAGVSVSGPSARLPDEALIGIGDKVKDAAQQITEGIGGRPPSGGAVTGGAGR